MTEEMKKPKKEKRPKTPPVVEGTHLIVHNKGYIFLNVTDLQFMVCIKLNTICEPPEKREFVYRFRNKKELHKRWTRWWDYPKSQVTYDLQEEEDVEEHKIETMKIAVVDIETTGFSPDYDKIVEIGIVELDLSDGSTRVLFDKVILEDDFNESCENAWVFNNSDLTFDEVLNNGTPIEDERLNLQIIFDSYHVTAFNSAFDIGFLQKRGFAIPRTTPCIMKSATPVVGIFDSRGRNKWPSVEEAWHHFFPDEPYAEKHRAADDALHEAKILYKMITIEKYRVDPVVI